MIPSDPMILLSYVNTHLRDEGIDLTEFCDRHEVDREELVRKLAEYNYHYIPAQNAFR